jgi:hypothetical protein
MESPRGANIVCSVGYECMDSMSYYLLLCMILGK